jgi:hypothetical protein
MEGRLKDLLGPGSKNKIALFDIGLNRVVATGKNRLLNEEIEGLPLLKRDLARCKFLKGSVCFGSKQLAQLKPWIEKHGVKKMEELFSEIHERFGIARRAGSSLDQLFFELNETIGN